VGQNCGFLGTKKKGEQKANLGWGSGGEERVIPGGGGESRRGFFHRSAGLNSVLYERNGRKWGTVKGWGGRGGLGAGLKKGH